MPIHSHGRTINDAGHPLGEDSLLKTSFFEIRPIMCGQAHESGDMA
jgi:hypothetical protein